MTRSSLLASTDLDAPLAWRAGRMLSRRQYLADVAALARRLPQGGPVLNIAADRYNFAVGLGAATLRGQANLLPPNHLPDMIARLREEFTDLYCLADAAAPAVALPTLVHDGGAAAAPDAPPPPLAADAIAAHVLTSGSTGAPVAHTKRWGLLVENIGAEAERIAAQLGRNSLDGIAIVATVPAQHMYGFESSVLLGLLGGAAFESGRPFFPADIAAALASVPRPRVLVTTPFHLRTLLDAGIREPLDLIVCATAPLSPQLAAQAETALGAPLLEIYGCTEAGQVATRRTTAGAEWRVYRGLQVSGDGDIAVISGGHVPQPTRLADVLEVLDPQTFRLLGRANDLINVAGKRSSLAHLNFHLNSIDGVRDGAFWLPPDQADAVVRPVAFVVAPSLTREALLSRLRPRIDAAFLPRRIVHVPALPRDPTGKLPLQRLAQMAQEFLGRDIA